MPNNPIKTTSASISRMIWRLSGWSSTTKMRLLMPFPPAARLRLHSRQRADETRLRGLPFRYRQCHYCIGYTCGGGWWRAPRLGGALLVEPHVSQVLIEVVTRTDLPSFHVGSQRNDPVPVGDHQLVHFGIEYVLLEIAHQCPLFRSVGLVQHLLVQIDLELVVVVPIVLAEHGMRQVFLDIEKWVHHAVAAGLD